MASPSPHLQRAVPLLLLIAVFAPKTCAKIYDRCELARDLRPHFPLHEIPTWLCIAHHESSFNTSAWNRGSGDHGLFQISDQYWCSPPGNGYACGQSCAAYEDDLIADDVACVKRIYREHQQLSGDGFNAWTVYHLYCRNPVHNKIFMADCFPETNEISYNHQHHYSAFSSSSYYYSNNNNNRQPAVQFHYDTRPTFNYNHKYNFNKQVALNYKKSYFNTEGRSGVTAQPQTLSTYLPFLLTFTQQANDLEFAGSEVEEVTVEAPKRRPLRPLQQTAAMRPFRPLLMAIRNQTLQNLINNLPFNRIGNGIANALNASFAQLVQNRSVVLAPLDGGVATTKAQAQSADEKPKIADGQLEGFISKVNDSQFSYSLYANGFTIKKT